MKVQRITRVDTTPAVDVGSATRPDGRIATWEDRICHEADSTTLILDLRHARDPKPALRTFNLCEITLYGGEGPGVYRGVVVRLGQFPHLLRTLSAAMIEEVQRTHAGRPDKAVPALVGGCRRIFGWMLSEGFYSLRDVPLERLQELATKLQNSTWFRVLRWRRTLARLYLQARADKAVLSVLRRETSNGLGLNISALVEHTGIPISAREVPLSFRRRIARLRGDVVDRSGAQGEDFRSGGSLLLAMYCLNALAAKPPPLDSFPYFPFPSANGELKRRNALALNQTPNLSLQDAGRILRHSVMWVFDRGPVLLRAIRFVREVMEEHRHSVLSERRVTDRATSYARQRLRDEVPNSSWLTEEPFNCNHGSHSLGHYLDMLLFGAATLVGINHGRRVNEVIGTDLPYGLYYGCLKPYAHSIHEWTLDIYCEKGWKEYRQLPANAIVAQVVTLLEKFSNEFLSFGAGPRAPAENIDAARLEKLFLTRRISVAGFRGGTMVDFRYRRILKEFMTDAGVDHQRFNDAQWPYRRLFITIYFNRYDAPELLAMSDYAGHMSVLSTIPYSHDQVARPPGLSIPELLGEQEDDWDGMRKLFREGAIEHIAKQVTDLLSGKLVGGYFARLVFKLAKSMGRSADFRRMDTERKGKAIAELLSLHGYEPTPMPHNSCMAGSSRSAVRRGNCRRDGSLRKEEASHPKCSKCLNGSKAPAQLDRLRAEAASAREASTNPTLPALIRLASQELAAQLDELVLVEAKIAQENAAMFDELVTLWQKVTPLHEA